MTPYHSLSCLLLVCTDMLSRLLLLLLLFVVVQTWPIRYTMFQWDNHFASLMMAMGGPGNSPAHSSTFKQARQLALSNYIQTVRSTKTALGFGSNYAAAGSKSVDRTEPPQAARVLLTLFRKYNDTVRTSF